MTRKRKHRVVVEITTSQPVTEMQACSAVGLLLDGCDTQARPIWLRHPDLYADRLTVKEFSRVYRAKRAKE